MKKTWKWLLAQKLEIKWWERYLSDKDESYLEYKKKYWIDFLASSKRDKISKDERLLDVGCGPAGIYIVFPDNKVTATDPLIDVYENKLKLFSRKKYPYVDFKPIPFEKFKADAKSFDRIFCLNAINHFSDINDSLIKLNYFLNQGGYLYLSIDVHKRKWVRNLFRIIPLDFLHPHQHTLADYQQKLAKYGFVELEVVCVKKRVVFDYYLIVSQKTQTI